jgi:Reverse transcriptase (RNA-dependent DNA polymerase)
VLEPTRNDNILDLVFTDEPLLVLDVVVLPPFGNSDHNCVEFVLTAERSSKIGTSSGSKCYYHWKYADYTSMKEYLYTVDWGRLLSTHFLADDLWDAFCCILHDCINSFVPIVKCAPKLRKAHKPKIYPKFIRDLHKQKHKLWRKIKDCHNDSTSTSDLINIYRSLNVRCKKALRDYEVAAENKIISANNIGKFYQYVNNRLSSSKGVGTLLDAKQRPVTSDSEKANLLNSHFGRIWTIDNGLLPPFADRIKPEISLDSVTFTPEAIYGVAKQIKSKTSRDPDGFNSSLIKKLIPALSLPLSLIFNSFMSTGKLPSAWKRAIVTPIYKKGPASDPSNYRPISVTSVFGKLMERIVVKEIHTFLAHHKLLNRAQHGFLRGKSTTTNLLDSLNDWTLIINNKKSVIVAYIDFAKAFDSVSHPKLFRKLEAYGIRGLLLNLIKDFLTGRTQYVKVGDFLSDVAYILSGVIQGSCIGPLLFVIFINDLMEMFTDMVRSQMFADDLKLYTVLTTSGGDSFLQEALNKLCAWAKDWQLPISTQKCHILHIGNCVTNSEFLLNSDVVDMVSSYKDLGVTMDQHLTFSEHVQKITANAHKRANLILKTFVSKDARTLIKAFNVYVRPLLEYCSSIWSPATVKDVNAIEQVQRRFTKRLWGCRNRTYGDRLKVLNTEPLELRRIKSDLILAYKIIFGHTDLKPEDFFKLNPNRQYLRGHQFRLSVPSFNNNTRKNFFSVRIAKVWNALPKETDFTSLRRFRNSIDAIDFTKYCIVKM